MNTEKILLVDDEEEFISVLAERMQARGVKVDAVTSGADAVEQVKETFYDAVILDMAMPGMDGIETLKHLLEVNPDLQVIFLTGKATLEKAVEAGQHVGTGQYLGTIYAHGALEIEVRIAVKDLQWLPAGIDPDHPVEAEIVFGHNDTTHIWEGRLIRMKAQMEKRTRTLPVIIGIHDTRPKDREKEGVRLRPGMFVRVKIKGKEISRAFVLPRHVVHAGDVVYTVNDRRLKIKPVRVLRTYKETVIVTEGLSDGERIIKSPLSSPMEGMLLRIETEER